MQSPEFARPGPSCRKVDACSRRAALTFVVLAVACAAAYAAAKPRWRRRSPRGREDHPEGANEVTCYGNRNRMKKAPPPTLPWATKLIRRPETSIA